MKMMKIVLVAGTALLLTFAVLGNVTMPDVGLHSGQDGSRYGDDIQASGGHVAGHHQSGAPVRHIRVHRAWGSDCWGNVLGRRRRHVGGAQG